VSSDCISIDQWKEKKEKKSPEPSAVSSAVKKQEN
jgi:hypothetical protein